MDTIFALSSGAPPAGIGVIRITGPSAGPALVALAGSIPPARRAARAILHNGAREPLDDGLVLWFPSPNSVTGEDVAELHIHGGRAVIAAVELALTEVPGLRRAEAGEFTRRAFSNGKIDLAEAEGLADLLAAETEIQRRAAMTMAGGQLSRQVEAWRDRLLALSAQVEAVLDFEDEDDVGTMPASFADELVRFAQDIAEVLATPSAEMLREGYRVALAGPPNAGKSTLFNALVDSDAAITAEIAGTTRDVLIRAVSLGGVPFSFVDMAGLRSDSTDVVEAIGITRAQSEIERADLVLWLGEEGRGPIGAWEIQAQSDRPGSSQKINPDHRISALTGVGMPGLKQALVEHGRSAMPGPGEGALNQRQRNRIVEALAALSEVREQSDPLLLAESLRRCRLSFDALLGRTSTEDVLDTLFGRFCIGK